MIIMIIENGNDEERERKREREIRGRTNDRSMKESENSRGTMREGVIEQGRERGRGVDLVSVCV